MKRNILWLAILCALVSCGNESLNSEPQIQAIILPAGEILKKADCTKNNLGEMVYVVDSVTMYYCSTKGWKELVGEKGTDGNDGLPGNPGSNEKCSIIPDGTGVLIVCGQDTSFVVTEGCSVRSDSLERTIVNCGADSLVLENGREGAPAKDCVVEKAANGFKVLCDGDSVEYLENGAAGFVDSSSSEHVFHDTVFSTNCEYNQVFDETSGKCVYTDRFTDERDGHVYRKVQIGNQIWMAQNLNYAVNEYRQSICVRGVPDLCEKYGRLYTWSGAMGLSKKCDSISCSLPNGNIRGVCPEGWHLPSDSEVTTLYNYVIGHRPLDDESDGELFLAVDAYARKDNPRILKDPFGFSAQPVGIWRYTGRFTFFSDAYFLTSTEWDEEYAGCLILNSGVLLGRCSKVDGYSVRCVYDEPAE